MRCLTRKMERNTSNIFAHILAFITPHVHKLQPISFFLKMWTSGLSYHQPCEAGIYWFKKMHIIASLLFFLNTYSAAAPLGKRDWWHSSLWWRLNECLSLKLYQPGMFSFKGHAVWLQENTVNMGGSICLRGWGAEEEEDVVVVQYTCVHACVCTCVIGGGGGVVKGTGK